jgi:hypothetical protein
MKKSIGIIVLIFVSSLVNAQRTADALFEKYSGRNGFVSVTINGNLLRLAAAIDGDRDDDALPKNIKSIRILAQDEDMNSDHSISENFYDLVSKDLDLTGYEEFMEVKEHDQNVKMLVRTEGNKFTEFLLIVGGHDNALIQIKGSMTMEEARKFSDDARKNHGVTFNYSN